MDLSEISSAISNAAPYAAAAETLGNALNTLGVLGIDITKLINPTQSYDQQHQDRVKKAADLISSLCAQPGPDTERALNDFLDELLVIAGSPIVGGITTELVTVRVDRLLAFCNCTSKSVALQQFLDDLTAAAKQQPAATEQVTPTPATEAKL